MVPSGRGLCVMCSLAPCPSGAGHSVTSTKTLDGILSAIQTAQAPPRFTLSFLDQTEAPNVLAEGLQDAYADLFQLNRNANELGRTDLKNKLKTLTQGQHNDSVLGKMAGTFIELANRADFIGGPAPQRTTDPVADNRRAAGGRVREVLTRAKRVGVAWQRRRRSAALFLEWFRLCVRHGWLASPRVRKTRRNAVMHFGMSAGSRLKNGRAAIAAGPARHGPPGAARSGPRTPPHPERARDLPGGPCARWSFCDRRGPFEAPVRAAQPSSATREVLRPAEGAGLRSFRRSS